MRRALNDNMTRKDIMKMTVEELNECISSLPLEHPLFKFVLDQRSYEVQRRGLNNSLAAILMGVVTLIVVISIYFAEDNDWSFGYASASVIGALAVYAAGYGLIFFGVRKARHGWERLWSKIRRPE